MKEEKLNTFFNYKYVQSLILLNRGHIDSVEPVRHSHDQQSMKMVYNFILIEGLARELIVGDLGFTGPPWV